jgi:hypothetical protein
MKICGDWFPSSSGPPTKKLVSKWVISWSSLTVAPQT